MKLLNPFLHNVMWDETSLAMPSNVFNSSAVIHQVYILISCSVHVCGTTILSNTTVRDLVAKIIIMD